MASRRERVVQRTRPATPPRARHKGGRSFRRPPPRSGSRPFLPDEEHALFNAAVTRFAVCVFAPFRLVKKVNIGHVGCAALRPRRRIGSHEFRRTDGMEYEEKRSEEHTSELQSPCNLVCRLLLEKKN